MPLRVVVAEDSVLLRVGIRGAIERFGHQVVAEAEDVDGLLAAHAAARPDIVLTDVRMPPTFRDEGLVAALALRRQDRTLPVLVLSQYVEPTYAAELLADGATGGLGYLLKERVGDVAEFVASLEKVAAGGTVVDPDVVRQLVRDRRHPVGRLSTRELDVLELMAQGLANDEIATRLWVSDAAVAKHIRTIFTKLDLPPDAEGHRRVLAVLSFLGFRT